MRLLFRLAVCIAFATPAAAQSSIVPANHPIYDWLHMQRISGRIPTFDNEIRPTTRATVLEHLRTLERDSTKLSRTDRGLLSEFLNEFDFDRLVANRLWRKELFKGLPKNLWSEVKARRDPYVYAGRTKDSVVSGAVYIRPFARGEAWEHVRDTSDYTYLRTSAIKMFVNFRNGFGGHFQADKGYANGTFIYFLEPKWSSHSGLLQTGLGPAVDYDAWVSYARKYVDIHLGVGSSQYGPAVTDAVVLRREGPSITQFRARVGTAKLNFLFMHGQLQTLRGLDTITVNGAPVVRDASVARWVAISRLTWSPFSRLTGAVYQMTTYSGRGLELLYLNPLRPSMFTSVDYGDRDNSLVGFDIVGRPFRGTELFLSTLVDDAMTYNLSNFGSDQTKLAGSIGLEQRLPFDVRLGASVIHVDPFVYTHTESGNAWEQHGVPLGAAIGPNSDELAIRLTRWFPLRTRLMVGIRRIRNGLNPVDSSGTVTNVGGDITSGMSRFHEFMTGADVQTYRRNEIELESEPIRAFRISLRFSENLVRQGTRVAPRHSIFIRWGYGF